MVIVESRNLPSGAATGVDTFLEEEEEDDDEDEEDAAAAATTEEEEEEDEEEGRGVMLDIGV